MVTLNLYAKAAVAKERDNMRVAVIFIDAISH